MTTPDVRVRLSAEGVTEVVAALRKVQSEANLSSAKTSSGFASLNSVLAGTKGLLTAIGLAVGVGQVANLGRTALQAADSVSKMGQRVGSTAEKISALVLAAQLGDVEVGGFEKALGALAQRIDDLRANSPQAADDFSRIGLAAKDFPSDDIADNFLVVTKALQQYEAGQTRAALAMKVFGARVGRDLLPFIDEMAGKTMPELIDTTRKYGLLLDTETAHAIQAFADATKELSRALLGAATQFIRGFSPAFTQVVQRVNEGSITAIGSFKGLGQAAGTLALRFLPLVNVIDAISSRLSIVTVQMDVLARASILLAQRRYAELAILSNQANEQVEKITSETEARIRARHEQLLKALQQADARGASVAGDGSGIGSRPRIGTGQGGARSAAAAAREIEKAKTDILRAEDEIAEAQGRRHEVVMRQISERAEELRRSALLLGKSATEARDLAQQYLDAKTAAENFNQLELEFQRKRAAFDLLAKQYADDRNDGLLTEAQYQEKIRALEAERLPGLRELVVQLQAAAVQAGDNALLGRVNELAAGLRDTVFEAEKSSNQIAEAGRSALEQFLGSGREQFRSFLAFMRGIAEQAANLFQRILAGQVVDWIFSFGGKNSASTKALKLAGGGLVTGPGTGSSDSIPAWLSNLEFVVPEPAVRRGGNLQVLEQMRSGAAFDLNNAEIRQRAFYSASGLPDFPARPATAEVSGQISLVLPPGVNAEWLDTSKGRKQMIRFLVENRRAINRGLGHD